MLLLAGLLPSLGYSQEAILDFEATKAVVSDLIVAPVLSRMTNEARTKRPVELVVVEDATLRTRLRDEYKELAQWLLFDGAESVVWGGQSNFHRSRAAYVNKVTVLSSDVDKLEMQWSRDSSSQGGTVMRFKLIRIKGGWSIVDLKLITVA